MLNEHQEPWIATAVEALAGGASMNPEPSRRAPRRNSRARLVDDTQPPSGAQPEADDISLPEEPTPRAPSKRGRRNADARVRDAAPPAANVTSPTNGNARRATSTRGHCHTGDQAERAAQPPTTGMSDTNAKTSAAQSSGGQRAVANHKSIAARPGASGATETNSLQPPASSPRRGQRKSVNHHTSASPGAIGAPRTECNAPPATPIGGTVTGSADALGRDALAAGGTDFGGHNKSDNRPLAAAGADDGQRTIERQPHHAVVGTITEQHRRRWDFIRARQRLELQSQAVCRRLSGGDKVEAAKLWAAVKADPAHPLRTWLAPFLAAMAPLLGAQKDVELSLVKLVKQTPIYEFASQIKGLGDVSLAAIIGECAAPIGEYRSVSALWKRMGLAVIGGERQRRIAGEAAIEHGYNAQRRSIMWNIGAGLIKAQVRKDPDDEEKRIGTGEYGALYLERKAIEILRTKDGEPLTKAHAHNRAQRYIEKRLLRELWKADRRNG